MKEHATTFPFTRDEVVAWVLAQPAGTVFEYDGFAVRSCPMARYGQAHGYPELRIGITSYWYSTAAIPADDNDYLLPSEIVRLVQLFDRVGERRDGSWDRDAIVAALLKEEDVHE